MKNAGKKTILVVADTLDVEKSSGAKGRVALINSLLRAGYRLKVYHYSRKEVGIEGVETIAIKEKHTSIWYILAKIQLLFTRVTNIAVNKYIEGVLGFSLTYYYDVASIKAAIRKEQPADYDMILALSYAISYRSNKAIIESGRWQGKLVSYIHDPYPYQNFPRPYDEINPGLRQKHRFFKSIVKQSRSLIYPSQLLSEWMASYYPGATGKSYIIPHQLPAIKDLPPPPKYFQSSRFNLVHAGSLMAARNPTTLLNAFVDLLSNNQEFAACAHIHILGSGNFHKNHIDKIASEHSQINHISSKVDFHTVLSLQRAADVHIILEARSSISPFLPGKVAHAVWGNNKMLLLGPYYSEVRQVLGTDYKYWSENDDESKIKALLLDLFEEWKINKSLELNLPQIDHYFSIDYFKKIMDKV
ncbi:MAG: hypothetical protein WBA16_03330 [Nonlabens sp.]